MEPVPLILENVAASVGTANPSIVVDWLTRTGNGGGRAVDAPTISVEDLLTVNVRRWTCAEDAKR